MTGDNEFDAYTRYGSPFSSRLFQASRTPSRSKISPRFTFRAAAMTAASSPALLRFDDSITCQYPAPSARPPNAIASASATRFSAAPMPTRRPAQDGAEPDTGCAWAPPGREPAIRRHLGQGGGGGGPAGVAVARAPAFVRRGR